MATLGAAGFKGARNALAETQSAILALVPHLDMLVFIPVALGGIAVTIHARLDD